MKRFIQYPTVIMAMHILFSSYINTYGSSINHLNNEHENGVPNVIVRYTGSEDDDTINLKWI